MSEKPILFLSEMVRAILEGRKTQTRRICQLQPDVVDIEPCYLPNEWGFWHWEKYPNGKIVRCPYGQPGDSRLWVQEGYQITACPGGLRRVVGHYLEDGSTFSVDLTGDEYGKWDRRKFPFRPTPGRFMYKSLTRIKLEVLNIRVERVQDISESDAYAEGIDPSPRMPHPILWFKNLWDSINAKRGYGWKKNLWVWVVEFKRIEP